MPKIIEAELREYWDQEMPVREIAGLFNVRPAAVYRASRRLNLLKRHLHNPGRIGRRDRKAVPVRTSPEAEFDVMLVRLAKARAQGRIVCPPGWDLESDVQVRVTGGRYAALRELAARLGTTFDRVLARWHVVRVV